jgi:predicted CXXCH cytochrome family protein
MDCHQVHQKALKAASESRFSFDKVGRAAFAAASVSPETDVILRPRAESNEACLKCHQTQAAQMSMPYHHPLREGKMSCADCHDPHGGPAGNNLKTANANQLCLTCHAQYRGPYAYQHPPVTENCLLCHTAHGSPNSSMLSVSEPALCLQCHAGHHNGASLPLADRCTNCHVSIHGTDVATPSGGSRFVDKGPTEPQLLAATGLSPVTMGARTTVPASTMARSAGSQMSPYAFGAPGAAMGMLSASALAPLSVGGTVGRNGAPAGTETGTAYASYSLISGGYRFVDGSGYLGRVGEYDSLRQSAGSDLSVAYVSPTNKLTVVTRADVLSSDDYSTATQLTAGERLQVGLFIRSFKQQQDNYPFYAFPKLDVQVPGSAATPLPNCAPSFDCSSFLIPSGAVFGVTRRLGNAYGRAKVPKLPVHLFVRGDWEARSGATQLSYLDENSFVPIAGFTQSCGAQCHFQSQFQPVNYTTRNVGGGADVKLGQFSLTWEHYFSSFNDRLQFPVGVFTGPFTPAADSFGYSSAFPVPAGKGPTPGDVNAANYFIAPVSPSQASTDRVSLSWTVSPELSFNGNLSYARLRNTYTTYPQNSFDSDETLSWRPFHRLRLTADYHQQNLVNDFVPYYTQFGNLSYHDHAEGLRLDYELPKGFDIEPYYRRGGITRSNAFLWPQLYSVDNTDIMTVVGSSFSNTAGLALRYHNAEWSARTGYEWTGTHSPGYLTVPKSNNRAFADVWLTPRKWLVFANDVDVTLQNDFPGVALPNSPNAVPAPPPASQSFGINIAGLPPTFQRSNRFYTETATATLRFVSGWNLGLGYSYQQNNMTTYMAFQNDSATNYILDEPAVPYKQITQAYWADSTYTFRERMGLNFRVTYNSARSGFRPDLNPVDAAKLGNAFLISQGNCDTGAVAPCFSPSMFSAAMGNLGLSSTLVSQVIVPQWIGQSRAYYLFPYKFEGGVGFYYGSYRDYWNPSLNGVLRTFNVYIGRSW